jgi:hypothetical protein
VRKSQSKLRLLYRLPEIDFVDAWDVRDDIEPSIIRDADIEPHLHPAKIGRPYCRSYSFKVTMPSAIRLYMPKKPDYD